MIQEIKALQERRAHRGNQVRLDPKERGESLASKVKKALKEKRALQVSLGYLVIKDIQD